MDRDSILRLPTQTDAAGRESDAPHPEPADYVDVGPQGQLSEEHCSSKPSGVKTLAKPARLVDKNRSTS